MAYKETKTDLVVNKMTKAIYESLLAKGEIVDTEIYYITDDNDIYYLKSEVYTKAEIDALLKNIDVDLTGYATENYVDTKVADLVNSAPSTLDTLGELATALQENESVVNTVNAAITNKQDKLIYTESLPEDTSTMKAGDIVLVPGAGSSTGGSGSGISVTRYTSSDITVTSKTLTSSDSGYDVGYKYNISFTIPDYSSIEDLSTIRIIVKDKTEQYNPTYRYLIFELCKYTEGSHSFSISTAIGRERYWPINAGCGNLSSSYNEYPTVFLDLNGVDGTVKIYGSNYGLSFEEMKIYKI